MADRMMQAVRMQDYGGPDKLVLESMPRPEVQPQAVLVRVYAAGVNPHDWKLRAGRYKQSLPIPLPYIPGIEFAGLIEDIGAGITELHMGQAVYGTSNGGSYAEYVSVPPATLATKPALLSFEQAAAIPIGALTAWRALIGVADVQPRQRVFIQGGSGGVGSYAVQLAHWKGAHVIATSSSQHLDFVRSLGAQEVIDYRATPFESVVHDMDVAIDTVGDDVTERTLKVLKKGGMLVAIAGRPPEEKAMELSVRAMSPGRAPAEQTAPLLVQFNDLISQGKLQPVVGEVFPLARAAEAQAIGERGGGGHGRIILKVRD